MIVREPNGEFSREAWAKLVGDLPIKMREKIDLAKLKTEIECAWFLFDQDVMLRDCATSDLGQRHRHVADLALALKDAYSEDLVDPGYSDNFQEREELIFMLEELAEYHRAEAELCAPAERKAARGASSVTDEIAPLAAYLIRLWQVNGGEVAPGKRHGDGGPLVRFLRNATRPYAVRGGSTDTIRGWIKNFKSVHVQDVPHWFTAMLAIGGGEK